MYQSEIAPREYVDTFLYTMETLVNGITRIRGRIISVFQCFVNFGILVAFWIQFGTSHIDGSASWRLPMGLQMIVSSSRRFHSMNQ